MSALHVVGPDEGRRLTALGSTYRTMTDGTEVAGAYALVEERFWGDATPLHRHVDAEETFYVLDGEVEVWAGGATRQAGAGDLLVVPRGMTHGLRRVSAHPVRMLVLASPPGLERLFQAVVDHGEEALLADPQRLVDLAAAHGTEIVGEYPGR